MDCSWRQASLSITNSRSLLKLMSMVSVMPSNHLILRRPLLLLPSIFPSIGGFSSESTLHIRWPKYWGFHISPSNEYSGLIFFRIDWLDLLAVQRTLKSLLQHHSLVLTSLWSQNEPPAWSASPSGCVPAVLCPLCGVSWESSLQRFWILHFLTGP